MLHDAVGIKMLISKETSELRAIPGDIYLAALQGEVAAEAAAPLELLGHVVVGLVPAGVLHQGHGDAAVDGVLGVGPRHRLVLEQPLLPVGQRRALLPLVLQLRPRQLRKIRLLFSKQML